MLRKRRPHSAPLHFSQSEVFAVAGHADDHAPRRVGIGADANAASDDLADVFEIGPMAARQCLVDNHDALVPGRENAAAQERRPRRLEIPQADALPRSHDWRAVSWRRLALNADLIDHPDEA